MKKDRLFLLMVTCFWFAQYIYIPYQATFLGGHGVSSSFLGIIVGAYGMSQLLLRLPVGVMADAVGRHRGFIRIGCLASGLASVFRVLWCGGNGFLIANLFSGVASAMWISFMVYYTGSFPQKLRQAATGRIVMYNNLGMLLGFITSLLCYQRVGMKGICLLSLAAGLMAFFLSGYVKDTGADRKSDMEAEEAAARQPGNNNWELLSVCKDKRLWMFGMIALIQQGIQLTTAMSFTGQLLKNLGASDSLIGVSSVIYMLSAVGFSALGTTRFFTRKGPSFWIPAVLLIIAFYHVLAPGLGSINAILALQLLPGISTGILFSYATSEAMKYVPEQKRSTAMGFFQAMYALGMTVFPAMTGAIATTFQLRTGYLLLAGISAAGSLSVVVYYNVIKNRKYVI